MQGQRTEGLEQVGVADTSRIDEKELEVEERCWKLYIRLNQRDL